jgi:dihydrodipicolinate synthase/N-acetylneuraminate lyase
MRNARALQGIVTALATPFTADDRIDEAAIERIVERQISAGVGGVLAAGSSGEFFTLSAAERRQVLETTKRAAKDRVPVIANSSAPSTRETIEFCLHAQQAGAAATLVMPWTYEPLPFDAVITFYKDVASSIDIPVVIYDAPNATGIDFTTEQRIRLGELPGVDFIKFGAPNFVKYWEMRQTKDRKIELISAWDSLIFSSLVAGSPAVLSGGPNLLPEFWVAIFKAINLDGDIVRARRIWDTLWPVCHFLEREPYVSVLKAGSALLGDDIGEVRKPLLPLSEEVRGRLDAALNGARTKAAELGL